MEGYQQARGRRTEWVKVQGISSIRGRQKIDSGKLRIAQEMEKPKNLYVRHMDMNYWGDCWREWGYWEEGDKGGKTGTTVKTFNQ